MIDASTAPAPNRWRAGPIGPQIVRAVGTIGLLTLLSRVAMAARDIGLADKFGTHPQVDALVVALVLPLFGYQIIAGTFPLALIPTYTIVQTEEGEEAAERVVSSALMIDLGIAVGATLLLAVTAPLTLRVIGSGFDSSKLALTQSLFFILLPLLVFGTFSIVWGAMLNARHRFALPALTPTLSPLAAALVLFCGPQSWGIRPVAWAITGGAGLEAAILGVALYRTGASVLPRWSGLNDQVRTILRQYGPAAGGGLLMSSTAVVDQAVAAAHSSGSVAMLNYGGKAVGFCVGVGTIAVGSVVLPHVSAIAARRDWSGVRTTMRSYVWSVSAVTVPVTLVVVVLSRPLVELFFAHGAFTQHDAHVVSQVQALYMLQVPFFMIVIIAMRVLGALRRNQILLTVAAVNVVVNLVTDLIFVRIFGIPGIALSTSVVYVLAGAALIMATRFVLRQLEHEQPGASVAHDADVAVELIASGPAV